MKLRVTVAVFAIVKELGLVVVQSEEEVVPIATYSFLLTWSQYDCPMYVGVEAGAPEMIDILEGCKSDPVKLLCGISTIFTHPDYNLYD